MPELDTMLKEHQEMIIERDQKIEESRQKITEEYAKKLADHKNMIHTEVDAKIHGLS